jgi:hypothetical protein
VTPFQAMRLRNGGPSFKNFELLFEGANGSTTIAETFGATVALLNGPNIAISTAQFVDGASSLLSNGAAGSYLSTASSTKYDFGSGDFAIKAKIRPSTVTGTHMILTNRSSAGADYGFLFWQVATQVRFIAWGPTASTTLVDMTGGTIALNTWAELEVRRVGSAWNILQAGSSVASTTNSGTIIASPNAMRVGNDPSTGGREFAGYIDTLQIFKGGIV